MTTPLPEPPGKPQPASPLVQLVVSDLAGNLVGVPHEVILEVQDHPPADTSSLPELDLAEAWALPGAGGQRRSLLVRCGQGERRVLVGGQARLRAIPRSRLLPLPELLDHLRHAAGVQALFVDEDRIGFLLDVEWNPPPGRSELERQP